MVLAAVTARQFEFAAVEPAIGSRTFALSRILVANALACFAAATVGAGHGGHSAVEPSPRGIARTRSRVDVAGPVARASVGTREDGAGAA